MKKISLLALSVVFLASYSCKEAKKETKEAIEEVDAKEVVDLKVSTETIRFMMESKSGSDVKGEVTFTETDEKVTMLAVLTGLTEGEHAIHIHEKADCSSEDGKSTGGHWNPTFKAHAKWGATEGYHKGDIGNFTADAEGNATVKFSTEEWCIGCDDDTKNIIGKAVIVHQGVDDYTSQPSGAAGKRVSCTGIIK